MEIVKVPTMGEAILLDEFKIFTGSVTSMEVYDSRKKPSFLLNKVAEGTAIVLTGSYPYIDAVFRYFQHYQRNLVDYLEASHISDRAQRNAAFASLRRQKLHQLLLLARGDEILFVEEPPDTEGLQEWLEQPTGNKMFLIPVRRLQRILTDMQRAKEGIFVGALGGTITIFPHVYVPFDKSVPSMFVKYQHLITGKRVLDVGTGTGILALLSAKLGAVEVVATDSNPKAVMNARENVERFDLESIIQIKEPGDLFTPVFGEKFDIIIFNAPWIHGEPETLYDTALYDPDYRVIRSFMTQVRSYLNQSGRLLLQYSDISQRKGAEGMYHLENLIKDNGLQVLSNRELARTSRVLNSRETVYLFEIALA